MYFCTAECYSIGKATGMMALNMQIPRTDAKSLVFDHKILWVTGGYKTDGYRTRTTEFIDTV